MIVMYIKEYHFLPNSLMEMEDMTENKRIEVEELMWPVKLALAKVS